MKIKYRAERLHEIEVEVETPKYYVDALGMTYDKEDYTPVSEKVEE